MESSTSPNTTVFFKGKFCPLAEAQVGLLTHALHYGTGVFEGIRGYWSPQDEELYLFRPREHFERWKANAKILKMEIPFTAKELCELTGELIARNRFQCDVYIRPLVFKSREGVGVHFGPEREFAIVALPFGVYIDSSQGLRVCVSSWRRVDDNAIPARGKICGAYVNSALAGDEARSNGFDEAILLTADGHVAEGSASNIFLVRHGQLVTPPEYDDILEGITRATIIELARGVWVETIERRVDRSELYLAGEAFFTGTAFEIAPIIEVDRRPVGKGTIGPITRRLQESYFEVTRNKSARGSHWRWAAYREMGCKPAGEAAVKRN
jgi:branched-chain amino acid aminotransferase